MISDRDCYVASGGWVAYITQRVFRAQPTTQVGPINTTNNICSIRQIAFNLIHRRCPHLIVRKRFEKRKAKTSKAGASTILL